MPPALRLRSSSPADEAARFGRRVRDLAIDSTTQIVKRADVPHLVEVGRDGAAAAVEGAMDQVSGRRRRRQNSVLSVLIVATFVGLGLSAWWFARSNSIAALRAIDEDDDEDRGAVGDRAPDAKALSRAADDGLGIAWAPADTLAIPVPPEASPDGAVDLSGAASSF